VMAEQFMKKKIPDFFMNPSHMNSEYVEMMKNQKELIDDLRRQEETGEEMTDDEANIEEILQEIDRETFEQEMAKEAFLHELEIVDMQHGDEFHGDEFHFAPEHDQSDGKYDDEEENVEEEDDLKVKIVVKSISHISKMEKMKQWEEKMSEKGGVFWADNDENDW
jgi:hypothetical protein